MAGKRFLNAARYGILLALGLVPGRAELVPSRPKLQTSPRSESAEGARALLRSGKVDQADRLIRNAREMRPDDAALLCVSGDILFRQAQFSDAAKAYSSALDLDGSSACAYLGLGRIAQIEFRRKSAQDLFAKAFRINPMDPEISSAYARLTADLQTVSHYRLSSAYSRYELKLTGFHPTSSSPNGMMVAARINEGKPLRLIFDTGFSGILIDGKAARSLGLTTVSGSQYVGGLGDGRLRAVQSARARTVAFGNLEFTSCPIQVDSGSVTTGADGVIGADVFAQFQIALDARSRRLELVPLPDRAQTIAQPVYGVNHLLLVKTKINREKEGLFLLDTAAAFTSVSEEIARPWEHRAAAPLMGARGLLAQVFRVPPVELEFGGQRIVDSTPVALDLRQMSQQIGIEISGVLGYSLVGSSTLTINYRDGVVQLTE